MLGAEPQGTNGTSGTEGTNGHPEKAVDGDQQPIRSEKSVAAAQPAFKMTFSEYRRISNLLVLHMQKLEDRKNHLTDYSPVKDTFHPISQ